MELFNEKVDISLLLLKKTSQASVHSSLISYN